jgi:hypothetical protein
MIELLDQGILKLFVGLVILLAIPSEQLPCLGQLL